MDPDIQAQLDRAKELMQELRNACMVDLQTNNISGRTKNLTQEVLLKMKHLLDQVIRKFLVKAYPGSIKNSSNVYFPIVSDRKSLGCLGNVKMSTIMIDYPDFYQFIDSVQPYNSDYLWLQHLGNCSKDKHIQLTPQTIKEENETNILGCFYVGGNDEGANVSMDGFINGIPVNSKDISAEPLENFDPRLGVQRITWSSFVFSGTDINILQLCEKSIVDGEKIIRNILEFVENPT